MQIRPDKCFRCGATIKPGREARLEFDIRTNTYTDEGTIPAESGAGTFAFGQDCAEIERQRHATAQANRLLADTIFPERFGVDRQTHPSAQAARDPKFDLGQIVATPGALAAFEAAGQSPSEFIARHNRGDWGELDEEDRSENELSLREGFRLLSAYTLKTNVKIWVITERDRSATTILLPEEY